MTDLELVKRCAEKMGWAEACVNGIGQLLVWNNPQAHPTTIYNPLTNDAQAMALVKKFHLNIRIYDELDGRPAGWWIVEPQKPVYRADTIRNADLNRAIVECVAYRVREA